MKKKKQVKDRRYHAMNFNLIHKATVRSDNLSVLKLRGIACCLLIISS